MLAAVTALAALATDYNGTLTVDGASSQATVTINNSGNDYTVVINNVIGIGNIEITAPGTTSNGLTSVVTNQDIEAGNANLVLAFNQYAMTLNLDINNGGTITNVKFAQDGELTGYQIKNSGFENFKGNGEPIAWHGFNSATGTWAAMAPGSLTSSDDSHSGSKSAVMTSGSLFGVVGNGTMTTGRLNAGSTTANDPANCSRMDISDTNTDANGDPFYTVMHGRPDAITFWAKFVPKNTSYRASMSAIITDGTYYQDPENTTYTNKLATAKDITNIASCDWTEFSVPFNYIDKNLTGQALLVTFSTNSTPGGGAKGDVLYIDDVALVYNAAITGITVKGTALEGFAQDVYEYNFELANGETITDSDIDATFISEHAYLVKKVIETSDCYKVIVAVISNDLNTVKTYTINYTKAIDYTITVAETQNGTVEAPATAQYGQEVTVTVNPATGYEIETLTYTVEGSEPVTIENNKFLMPAANVTINATFKAIDYTITVAETQNGTVEAPATAQYGQEVTVTVNPATGYEIETLTYTVEGSEPVTIENNKFLMPAANVTINATFKAIDYTITVAEIQNGSVEAPATAKYGDEVALTVTPATGYELETLTYTVEGSEPVAIENNKFNMPAANVTINATFKANTNMPGDVNGDGEVNSVDITILYNYLLNGDTEGMTYGDQDGDGAITSVDITVVYNTLLGVNGK